MNLHVPQSEEARTEALLLMQVQDQILSPRFGGPIIGAIRDFVTSAYYFTRRGNYLNRSQVNRLLTTTNYTGPVPEPEITDTRTHVVRQTNLQLIPAKNTQLLTESKHLPRLHINAKKKNANTTLT